MRDVDDPELVAYLTEENSFAERFFEPHGATIDTIFDEIRSRVQETDRSTPVLNGGWWYVGSTAEGESYGRHHRGPTLHEAGSNLLLDENVEADRVGATDYFDLGAFDASHDHTMFAWSIDIDGSERYRMRIRRFADDGSFVDLDDEIDDVANAGTAWSADGSSLFFVRADIQERPFQVWRHEIGSAVDTDVLVYEEDDERFFVEIGETRSDAWIVIHSASKTSSEVRLLASSDPTADPRVVHPRTDGVEYQVDDWGDRLVMVTNSDGADDFRVLQADAAAEWTEPGSWTEFVGHEAGRRIIGVEPFESHLIVYEWRDAQPRLRLLFRDGTERVVDLGDEPHDVNLSANPEWTSRTVRFATQSMTVPTTSYDEDVVTGHRTLLRRIPTPNVDLDDYVASRMWATSPDGTSVPVDVVRHVDTPGRRNRPRLPVRIRLVRGVVATVVLRRPTVAARPRLRLGTRTPAGRRRTGSPVVSRRQTRTQAAHVRRHVGSGRTPRRLGRRGTRAAGDPRRVGGRVARRCLHDPATRAVRIGGCRGAVRRHRQHDQRSVAPADGHRMGGVG